MDTPYIILTWKDIIQYFFPIFTTPTAKIFMNLISGWILCTANAFKTYYQRMVSNGIIPANARHSVARKLVSTMSAMWKTGSEYDETLI